MLVRVITLVGVLLLSLMGANSWQIPISFIVLVCLLLAQVVSLIFFFSKPWIAVLTAWADIGRIFLGIFIPGLAYWSDKSLHAFVHQSDFDLIFFAAAHVGLAAHIGMNRYKQHVNSTTGKI
jgi:hypothetical protein